MSAQAPRQSPLERVKAEMNNLSQDFQKDLDSIRTAPVNELETRLHSLKNSFESRKESAIVNVETALKSSDKRIGDLERKLDEADRRAADLQNNLEAVKQQNIDLQADLEFAKRQPADLQERLKAAEKRHVDVDAHLKAATQRASTAEDELKAFKSRFKQINDMMTALGSFSEQQPTVSQPVSTSTPCFSPPDGVEERHDDSQMQDHQLQASDLDSHARNTVRHEESELLHCQSVLSEVMAERNRQYNGHFLKHVDPDAPNIRLHPDATTQSMDLDTMKEKLATGAYKSANSFKADFHLIIADCDRLNSPDSLVRNAAEELSRIFEQAWSVQRISSHQPSGSASSSQGTSNKKRKAAIENLVSTEDGHIQKRRSLAPLEQDVNHVHHVNPGTGESIIPASISPELSKDNSHGPEQTDASHVKRQITTGGRLVISATLWAVAQLVSVIKSPSTIGGHWKSLVPDEYRLTANAIPCTVEDRIIDLVRSHTRDVIILRLMPAAEADKPEFDRIFQHFLDMDRFVNVYHKGINKVENIYLIPASKGEARYPEFLSMLDLDLLPPSETEDVLFMAIVFRVHKDQQGQVLHAWDRRMKAIQDHDDNALASMRDALVRDPLPLYHTPRKFQAPSY
ncbi:hypothetical protein LA080_012277 [Diaporthe eres]|nr:hypothetical protein LA080_012277 [Diaporthe eres]